MRTEELKALINYPGFEDKFMNLLSVIETKFNGMKSRFQNSQAFR